MAGGVADAELGFFVACFAGEDEAAAVGVWTLGSVGNDESLVDAYCQPEPDHEELNAEVEGVERSA